MIRLLLDQGLPRSTVQFLREMNIDAVHVGEIGAATAADKTILEIGRRENRVIVTLDADFHAILAVSHEVFPSVIRIRMQGLRGEALAALIQRVIDKAIDDLHKGAIVTVKAHQIRVRRSPV